MPNLDDFYAFKSTSGGNGSGGSGNIFVGIIGIIIVLSLIGELFG